MKLTLPFAKGFLQDFSSIACTTSKRATRPILQCVNVKIDFEKKTMTLLSTDSAILTTRVAELERDSLENPEGYKEIAFNIPADEFIKQLKAFLPKKYDATLELAYDKDKDPGLLSVALNGMSCMKVRLEEGDYPVTDRILNGYYERLTDEKENRIVVLGAELLKSLVSYAEKLGLEAVRFSIPAAPGQQLRPIPFCVSQDLGKTYGIITPMRPY